MPKEASGERGFPFFRRAMRFLHPHRRRLVFGLLAAVGVSVFYTVSISSIVPLLKVIISEHETLADWLYRAEAERRLEISFPSDLRDTPGLPVVRVRSSSSNAAALAEGVRLVSVGGVAGTAHELVRQFSATPRESVPVAVQLDPDGPPVTHELHLKPQRWWTDVLVALAGWLPADKTPAGRLKTLAIVMVAFVVVSLLAGVCRFLNDGLIASAVQSGMHDLRSRMAGHVFDLPMNWHTSHPHGDTLGRFATDISKIEVGLTTLFGKVIREPLKAAGVITLTILIDWQLLFVAVVGLPIGVFAMRGFGRAVKQSQRRASQSWGRLLDQLAERLGGIRIVKAYNMQSAEAERFEHEGRELTHAQTHIELVDAATKPALETLAAIAVAAFILYGGARVFQGQLEPHLFFAAIICLGGVFDPVRKMGNVNNRLQAAEASSRRIFELLDQADESATLEPDGVRDLPPHRATVAFRDVAFAYPAVPDVPVLQGVSLEAQHGEVVAIVGPNGSGKTTLMALLARFFEPTRGAILIDGHDIATGSLRSLRQQIGLVTQDAVIFSGSVRDNIAYGAANATDDDLRRAAQQAHIDDFLQTLRSEHDGRARHAYDAWITSRSLSGGQKQRIALARAILRDPAILILDEATSQVDAESERKIQEALETVTRGRTTFIIAHRFSTIARADRVVVLEQGRVVGFGRHDELLETCSVYQALCQTQFAHAS